MSKIAFIGGGNMSSCIFDGICSARQDQDSIIVSGPHLEKLAKFAAKNAHITTDNFAAAKMSDIIFLGVKPQMLTAVLAELVEKGLDFSQKTLVSMAAGFKIASIRRITKAPNIVRIMPNTPAQIGLGVTGIFFEDNIDDENRQLIINLLNPLGMTSIVDTEEGINVICAVAGSAPAFLYRFMEALEAQGKLYGLSEIESRKVAEQVALGTASMVIKNRDVPISALREAVTSKGGTTYEGLQQMSHYKFEEMMSAVIKACMDKTHLFEEKF